MNVSASMTTPVAAPASPTGVGGFHGKVADLVRQIGDGFAAGARQTSVQADKGAIYPFETVATLTSLLKSSTAKVPVVSKATSMVHTIGGFALLIAGAQLSGALKAPGDTVGTLLHGLADAIDGKNQSTGFVPPWFAQVPGADGESVIAPSGVLAQLAEISQQAAR